MAPVVFLSRPSALASTQRELADHWVRWLTTHGFQIEELCREQYRADAWMPLQNLFRRVDGVLVLGFAQLSTTHGALRPGTAEEVTGVATWTSPWMQIETGMALMAGLPVLVVPEDGVTEGVFARSKWTGTLFGTSMSSYHRTDTANDWLAMIRASRCR